MTIDKGELVIVMVKLCDIHRDLRVKFVTIDAIAAKKGEKKAAGVPLPVIVLRL